MTVQTTYSLNHTNAYAGQIANMNPLEVVSKLAEGGVIPYGSTVSRGTADDQVTKGGTAIIGVAARTAVAEGNSTYDAEYEQYSAVNVVRDGYVYLTISENGADGGALNSVDATGVIGVGAATTGETDLTGWTLEEDVTAGNVALVRVRA